MKKITYILIVLMTGFWLLAVPGNGRAQERDVSELIKTARELGMDQEQLEQLKTAASSRGFTDRQLSEILQSAIAMSRDNLPAELVLQKVQEGISKGVPAERIMPVINRLRETAGRAVEIVDPWLENPEVDRFVQSNPSMSGEHFRNQLTKATSRALMNDVKPDVVGDLLTRIENNESVMQNATPPDIVAAVGIMPELSNVAGAFGSSGEFIVRAMGAGFGADELFKLPSAINAAHARSQLPASAVIERVSKQFMGGVPAKQILQNLFSGSIGGGPPGDIPKGLENRKNKGQGGGNG